MQARIRGSTVEACEVVGAVSDFFDGLGIAHEKADHPLFKKMVHKIQHAPPGWKPPCAVTLRTSILDAQHKICVDERSTALGEVRAAEESAKYGIPVELRDPRKAALAPVDAMDAANSEIRAHVSSSRRRCPATTTTTTPAARTTRTTTTTTRRRRRRTTTTPTRTRSRRAAATKRGRRGHVCCVT